MADIAKKVYLLARRDVFRAEPKNVDAVKAKANVEIKTNTEAKEVKGDGLINAIILNDDSELKVEGLFIDIGLVPSTAIIKDLGIETDEKGFIKVDRNMKTNMDGVYAAGDICDASEFKQIITAAAQGSQAVHSIFNKVSK